MVSVPLCVSSPSLSLRITHILKDQDGNGWRDKLPPNPDQERVLSALYGTHPLITSTPPLSGTAGKKPGEARTSDSASPLPSATPTKAQSPTPLSPTITQAIDIREVEDLLKRDEKKFEEYKKKGNELVKKVRIVCFGGWVSHVLTNH